MCISATAAKAFKSVLQEVKFNESVALYVSNGCCFFIAYDALMEPNVIDATIALGLKHRFMWLLLSVNSTMAYAANLTKFLVTKHTSALTLQVLGNVKGVVAVIISILIFRNPVTPLGITSYSLTFMGVVAYGEAKRRYK
ncbi:hypothetical protein L2E82_20946 [Cichorium intybus]|uniref:Uncharacterized protein n=1 Tax=Cichorium intybus TaxID=13427 RepID=A0ACB9DVN1_CICIN|nr:hypothetical protein L2E82_20946 [Cichorium intybus]